MIAIRERQDIFRAFGQDGNIRQFSTPQAPLWSGFAANVASPPCEAPLMALAGDFLARRFHGWRGHSGKRYVCTVFSTAREAGGFAEAIVIAVARGQNGCRRAVAIVDTGLVPDEADFDRFSARALQQGGCEWHVHLLASDSDTRRQVINDLEKARQTGPG